MTANSRLSKYFRNQRMLKYLLMLVFILGNLLQLRNGIADNGDWTRVMTWFTSGPLNFSTNWPENGTELYSLRFFRYWIPYWKLDFPLYSSLFSSVLFLWLPGVLLNRFFLSATILSLPVISLFPRFLVGVFIWNLFKWLDLRTKNHWLFYITIGLPLVLMSITTDYVAYFNSFYQETGSIVFLGLILSVIVLFQVKGQSLQNYGLYFVSIFLLATSKASNIYWPL